MAASRLKCRVTVVGAGGEERLVVVEDPALALRGLHVLDGDREAGLARVAVAHGLQ